MARLENLRAAATLDDVAHLLGFTPAGLSYVLYKLPGAAKYTTFDIPKRDGSKRHISAPVPQLALLQRRLANLLYDCLAEIEKDNPGRRSLAHGFARGRSIATNATLHKRRRYVLNLDLENFFPSFNFGRVRGFFIKDRYFALPEKVATVIAQIACHNNELPQGSPCSPIISNLIGHVLDARLARFAKAQKCTYSRYADDITFSTSRKDFPASLAMPVPDTASSWKLGSELVSRIQASGFTINNKKTRMQFRGSRQVTTGLLVNDKVNVLPEYYRTARAMCHSLFSTGAYYRTVPAGVMGGTPGQTQTVPYTGLLPLAGVLAHIDQIKFGLARKELKKQEGKRGTIKKDFKEKVVPRGFCKLYSDFLFYKNFLALEKPLILPEGKTDTIYLQCAIRQLQAYQPALGKVEGDKFLCGLRFMTYSPTVHEYLQLRGGFGDLVTLIGTYKKRLQTYRHAPMDHPIIVLVDNDDGGKKIFGPAKDHGVTPEMTLASTAPFYFLGANLYIIKTPEIPPDHKSCMEDLFDQSVKDVIIRGKIFDQSKDHEAPGKYGKFIFAEEVVKPNAASIDFSRFTPVLDRIVAVLADYKARMVASAAA